MVARKVRPANYAARVLETRRESLAPTICCKVVRCRTIDNLANPR